MAYALNPARDYSSQELEMVKGVECCLWTEYVPVMSHLEYMLLPRLDAFSEAAWTGGERDFDDFYQRLQVMAKRYDGMGLNYARHYIGSRLQK